MTATTRSASGCWLSHNDPAIALNRMSRASLIVRSSELIARAVTSTEGVVR